LFPWLALFPWDGTGVPGRVGFCPFFGPCAFGGRWPCGPCPCGFGGGPGDGTAGLEGLEGFDGFEGSEGFDGAWKRALAAFALSCTCCGVVVCGGGGAG
jgi:hypothetical protein